MKWISLFFSINIFANTCFPAIDLSKEIKNIVKYDEREGEGKIIAVIDTGIDISNPFLKDKILKDKNGKIVGLDLNNNNFKDYHGHGTHVSSIIALINPNNKIVPISYYDKNDSGHETLNKFIKGLEYVSNHPEIQILNISGGGKNFDERELKALKKIIDNGTIIITAAGNDSELINKYDEKESFVSKLRSRTFKNYYFPASYGLTGIISVMNVDLLGIPVESSNYGDFLTTGQIGNAIPSYDNLCQRKLLSGSSQSTAIMSGIISLWSDIKISIVEKKISELNNKNKKVSVNSFNLNE